MTRELQVALRRIGRRLAELRQDRGWIQERMAERLGVSLKYLQRLEAGRHNVSVGTLLNLAHALGVQLPSLFAEPSSLVANRGRPRHRATEAVGAEPSKIRKATRKKKASGRGQAS